MDVAVGTKPIDKGYVAIGWPEVGDQIVFKLAEFLRDLYIIYRYQLGWSPRSGVWQWRVTDAVIGNRPSSHMPEDHV
jgi:hypothetical protein